MSMSSSPPPPRSQLENLWADYERKSRRIDDVEGRLEENARRKRRRITNLLDQVPTHRRSHLRVFVTHNSNFTLIIEGRLLVGHLDHASVELVEETAAAEARLQYGNDDESSPAGDGLIRSTDRTLYRGKSENEGDVPVEKVQFTHFFDKMHVSTQTIFQKPLVKEQLSPKKSSRSKTKKIMDEKSLTTSLAKEYTWNRDDTADSCAWFVKYTPESPPPEQEVHSVVSTIKLWPRPFEKLYKPSQALASCLFPEHVPAPVKKKGKKKQEEEDTTIPLDNDIVVPSSLTMKEIISAVFMYIQAHKLTDQDEPSVIVNDKALSTLFQCDRMNFADVQQLLFNKQLVTDVTREPMILKYVMTKETASPSLGQSPPDSSDNHIPHVLSFDTDVYVEGVFHYRVRELLRRIKRREFEYTSSRTKARNMVCAGRANHDVVNRRIEDAVLGRGYTPQHIPVWLALAKAAPPKSEAARAAQIDAKMCMLLDRLEQHTRAAQAAWDVVGACRGEST